jgi:hypothetical protein
LRKRPGGWRRHPGLSGWLLQATRYAANAHIREAVRRTRREQEAAMQSELNQSSPAVWAQLEPLLDEAMSSLGTTDRTLLALRFYENKTGPEAAALLGLREAAVHKRTARALDKLRKFFTKRGVVLSAAAIAGAVSANSVQAAPAGLAAAITSAALSGTAIATTAFVAATKATVMTTILKALISATLVATVSVGIYEAKENAKTRAEVQTLQQQQAPLTEQIQQLRIERNSITNLLANLLAENAQLKLNSNQIELLKLIGEVTTLRSQLAKNVPEIKLTPDTVQRITAYFDSNNPHGFWITNNTERTLTIMLSKLQVPTGSEWQDLKQPHDGTLLLDHADGNENKQMLEPHEAGFCRLYEEPFRFPDDRVWRAEFLVSEQLAGQELHDAVAEENKFREKVEAKGFTNIFHKPIDAGKHFYGHAQLIYSEEVK